MYPVAISLWRYHPKEDWFRDFVSRSIVYFTGYDYTHVGVMVAGVHYDSTLWHDPVTGKLTSGIRTFVGWPPERPDFCMVPTEPFSAATVEAVNESLERFGRGGRPYNFFKLVVLAAVWPTRWFWKKIGWVPFDREVFGEVCSGFVDEAFKRAGCDLFPHEFEGYTVPGQFVNLKGWRRVSTEEVAP